MKLSIILSAQQPLNYIITSNVRVLSIVTFIGPIFFTIVTIVAEHITPKYNAISQTISQLAIGKYGWVETVAFVSVTITILTLVRLLKIVLPSHSDIDVGLFILVIIALCFILMIIIKTEPGHDIWDAQRIIHVSIGALAAFLFPIACLLITHGFNSDEKWRWVSTYTKITAALALIIGAGNLFLVFWWSFIGLQEHVLVLNSLLWIEIVSVRSYILSRRAMTKRRVLN